jgi:hypothetical protein
VQERHSIRDTVVRDKARTQKGLMSGKTHQMKRVGINGTRDCDLKEQQHLGRERTSGRTFKKALMLEIVKQRVELSVRIWKMNVRTLWRGRPPLKLKRRLQTQ